MPDFNRSVTAPLAFKPKHITTNVLLEGAFILIDEAILAFIRARLSAAEQVQLDAMIVRWSVTDPDVLKRPQTWGCPCWSGQSTCIYIQVPLVEMNGPQAPVSAKVARFFDRYYA